MPYMEDLMEEFKKDDVVVTDTEHEDKNDPQPEPQPEPEPAKDEPAKAEPEPQPETDDKAEPEPKQEPQPKPDLSQLSKEQKAEHAFKRQLSKQREKHEAEIKDLKDTFQKQFDDLKNSLKQPEPVKTRADFPMDKGGDDAYIKYLADQKVNEIMSERDQKAAKEAEERAAADEAARKEQEVRDEMTRSFSANSHAAFKDEAAFNAFSARVSNALNNGLGEVLDSVPPIRDFVFRNPEGPVVLDKMLTSEDAFRKVMSQTDPTMMIIAAHELASEPKQVDPNPVPNVVHMGKPGARNVSSSAGSMFNSDKDLIAYVRGVGTRGRR